MTSSRAATLIAGLLLEGRKANGDERAWLKGQDADVRTILEHQKLHRGREGDLGTSWQQARSEERRGVVLSAMGGDPEAVARLSVLVESHPPCTVCGGRPPRLTIQGDLTCGMCAKGMVSPLVLVADPALALFRVGADGHVIRLALEGYFVAERLIRPVFVDPADGQIKVAANTRTETYVLDDGADLQPAVHVSAQTAQRCRRKAASTGER